MSPPIARDPSDVMPRPQAVDYRPPIAEGEAPPMMVGGAKAVPSLKERHAPDLTGGGALLPETKEVSSKFRWAVDAGHYLWGGAGAAAPMHVGWGKGGATASTPRVVGEMVTMQGHDSSSSGNSAPVKKTYKRGGRGGESSSALVGGDEQIFAEQV